MILVSIPTKSCKLKSRSQELELKTPKFNIANWMMCSQHWSWLDWLVFAYLWMCMCNQTFLIMVMMKMLGLSMFIEKFGQGLCPLNPLKVVHFTSIHLHLSWFFQQWGLKAFIIRLSIIFGHLLYQPKL